MLGLKLMPSLSVAVVILLLISVQFEAVDSGPIAYAACEGACVTVFTACLSASLPIPGSQAACWAALKVCTDACLPVLFAPTP